jgi:hypothetical protein
VLKLRCQFVTGGGQVPPSSGRAENIFARNILKREGSLLLRWEAQLGEFDDRVDCDGRRRGECVYFLDACDRSLSRVEAREGSLVHWCKEKPAGVEAGGSYVS